MHNTRPVSLVEAQQKLEHYCTYQERCHKEVVEKLKQLGMIPIAIDTVVAKLIEDNYLNETRFAQSYARGKFRIKKWGKNRIKRELKTRQISDYNIKLGMKEIEDTDYENTFYELFEKRKNEVAHLAKSEQKRKLLSFLSYRGWEHQRIYNALNEFF